jgi:hypothetical protein
MKMCDLTRHHESNLTGNQQCRRACKVAKEDGGKGTHGSLQEDLNKVKNIFRDRADGTFLWVSLVVRELMQCSSKQLPERVQQLPRVLDGTYTSFLKRLETFNDCKQSKKVLKSQLSRIILPR